MGEVGDTLKMAITAPPIDGRANEACVKFLSELLDVPHSSIAIISGYSSRNKVIRLTGISADKVRERLTV
jgi:uncharacterized protein